MKVTPAQVAWEQMHIERTRMAEEFVRELQIVLHEKNVRIEQLEEELKQKTQPIVNHITINLKPSAVDQVEALKQAFKSLNVNG